ncbi:MAG: hypothetical protein EOM67_13695 [Spirochaetia bacterium]|nr:hypothetical protein [Spirochaetia bacterium]
METKTILGVFSGNVITDIETGEEFECITYGSVRKIIDEKLGFYNLRYEEAIDSWIVYQYILIEDE